MQTKKIPVLLLTGYLGSGKTTLVNHILKNKQGIRFAVIVNDIGEVNIDATLIQREGVVGMEDNSLVSLSNGCICCTLQTDLIKQVVNLMSCEKFDYIVIEASGICDPSPIAQAICAIPEIDEAYNEYGICKLDNIVTVVDAKRMADEFVCGEKLASKVYGEDDVESLLVQQIEFCSMILLNKVSEVKPEELDRIKKIIRALQPVAPILECDFADVDINKLIFTDRFKFNQVACSAGWVQEMGKDTDEHHHDHEHEEGHHHHDHGHCHHHHHNENGECEEYGISSFVYYRRMPLDINKFDYFINAKLPRNVIRTKGVCYFKNDPGMSYLFEQAGLQKHISRAGKWYVTMDEEEIVKVMQQEPGLLKDWDPKYGDRMQKLVFIGQHMDREQIEKDLDACLDEF